MPCMLERHDEKGAGDMDSKQEEAPPQGSAMGDSCKVKGKRSGMRTSSLTPYPTFWTFSDGPLLGNTHGPLGPSNPGAALNLEASQLPPHLGWICFPHKLTPPPAATDQPAASPTGSRLLRLNEVFLHPRSKALLRPAYRK